jgi:hypothetical protein
MPATALLLNAALSEAEDIARRIAATSDSELVREIEVLREAIETLGHSQDNALTP